MKRAHTHRTPPPAVDRMGMIKAFFDTPEVKANFEGVLGKKGHAFIISTLHIISQSEQLKLADIQSTYNASFRAALLGLSLDANLHLAHISPWVDKSTGLIYSQFQIGWRGLVQLCQRTDKFKTINVNDVRESELESKDGLSGEYTWKWEQDAAKRSTLPVIGYVSYFRLLSGFEKTIYWTIEDLKTHAEKYSESYTQKGGSWITDFPAMAKKTVLKNNLSDWAPKSTDLATAIELDQAVITGDGEIKYMDNPNTDDKKEMKSRKEKANAGLDALKKQLSKSKTRK